MKEKLKKLFKKFKETAKLFLNIRYLICYGLAWLIVHGWEYAIGIIGLITKNTKLIALFGSIYAFTYLPFVPENVVLTFPLSIKIQSKLFPQDNNLGKMLKEQFKKDKRKERTKVIRRHLRHIWK